MFPAPHEDDIPVTGDPFQPINNHPLYGEILEVLGAFLLNPLLRKKIVLHDFLFMFTF